MLVAGRVGGLVNYELFTQYQELAMKMFGGHIDFTWNQATKKLTLIRKIPGESTTSIRLNSLTASGLTPGSIITMVTATATGLAVGSNIIINECTTAGYNGTYTIYQTDPTTNTIQVIAIQPLAATSVVTFDLGKTRVSSPDMDAPSETIMLRTYNTKPDVMLLNDHMIFPWLQEYSYSFAKRIVGEARSKFGTIAGPQGGSTLNGDALKAEAQAEMDKLEEDIKTYVDGSAPLTWVIG